MPTVRVWCQVCGQPVIIETNQPHSLNPREQSYSCTGGLHDMEWRPIKEAIQQAARTGDDSTWTYNTPRSGR